MSFGGTTNGGDDSVPDVTLDRTHFKQAVTENTLRSCQLFVGLPAADITAVASFALTKHLAKGDYLFREGDPAQGFYIVQRGAVNVHRVSAAGKEQVIHVFVPSNLSPRQRWRVRKDTRRMRARRKPVSFFSSRSRNSSNCSVTARNSRCACSVR